MFRCHRCQTHFERLRATIAGLPLGSYECPHCGAEQVLSPEIFMVAAQKLLSRWEIRELLEVADDATRIAESWYASPEMAQLLCHRDTPLGPPTERELLPFIIDGLLKERRGGRP